ncbi:MAG TPA: hypothetical protein VM841_15370 [Actinomycetota bacterium]|nr:hypothetical protein [Actinomycetota bacterium]
MIRWKRSWEDLSEALPLDVMPCSNGEFYPPPPTKEQKAIMELADREVERVRKKFNMSRRDFVRTTAAMAICFWAKDTIYGSARAHNTATTEACDLQWDEAVGDMTLNNLPGEFIFDVQSHHVESDGMWRVTNPGFHAFFAGVWSQAGLLGSAPGYRPGGNLDPGSGNFSVRGAGAGELDPIENLSRYHYLKELFLDSATTMTVLSAVPAAPDISQPLPIERAALTVQMVNELAGSERTVMHAFVMPNRGSAGTVASSLGKEPVYMQREFEIMEERAVKWGSIIRGWKTYPAWGDIPYASGWFFDDELVGQRFIDHVRYISQKYPNVRPNIATHKGFALPAFDQRAASPRDIGPAASRNPDVNFIVYHSGFDGETMTSYGGQATDPTNIAGDGPKGDARVSSADRTVDSLIKSLRENNWDATRFGAIPGQKWANIPNVFAEIGSTWRTVTGRGPVQEAHLLGKLITYVGPKRIAWGTDSLWFGSPHAEIIAMRRVSYSKAAKVWDFYGLPYAIDGDADDPTVDTRNPISYSPSHPNAGVIPGWPTDGTSHPERSIRNWIFGRAAAEVYGVDADKHLNDRANHPISCDNVQKIRDAYILNQYTPKEQVPMASNALIGARTPQELKIERMNQPWAP